MTNMITRRMAVLIILVIATALPSLGQGARLELKNLDSLKSKANNVTDVALDGSMLELASQALANEKDADAAKAKDVISKLKGVYVKTFEFKDKNQYNSADLEPIRAQLRDSNWTKAVDVRENEESTEVYLMKEGETLIGLAVMVAEPQELTVVNIVGPIDLSKLGGLAGMMGKIDLGSTNLLKVRPSTGKKGSTTSSPAKATGSAGTPAKASAPAKATTPDKPNEEDKD